jgi:hypothetical protein
MSCFMFFPPENGKSSNCLATGEIPRNPNCKYFNHLEGVTLRRCSLLGRNLQTIEHKLQRISPDSCGLGYETDRTGDNRIGAKPLAKFFLCDDLAWLRQRGQPSDHLEFSSSPKVHRQLIRSAL